MKKLLIVLAMVLMASSAWAADVTLEWNSNTETDLAGYRVYYGSASGVYLQPKGSGINVSLSADENPLADKVQFTVKNIPKALTYFAVTAYDNEVPSLESGYSNEVFTNFGPSVPGGLNIKVTVEVSVP